MVTGEYHLWFEHLFIHLFIWGVLIQSFFCTSIPTISYHQLAAVCLIPPGAALLAIKHAATECVTLYKRQDLRQLNIERVVIFTGGSLNKAWFSTGILQKNYATSREDTHFYSSVTCEILILNST